MYSGFQISSSGSGDNHEMPSLLDEETQSCCLKLPGNKLQLILLNPSCEQFQGPMVTSATSSYSLPLLLWADYWPCVPGQG